jgi:cell filamentation protein
MHDPYLYPDSNVLRNLLDIHDEDALNLAEAEISRVNMMLIYEQGFSDFSGRGLQAIHKALFGDIYDWAGEFRLINIHKREKQLGGRSIWYANANDIERDMDSTWESIHAVLWSKLQQEEFAVQMARRFPALWKVHPFREGNTRTVVMLMTFFAEHYGFYFNQELLAASAEYVRDSFVMACIEPEYAEFEHLERILKDAVSSEPIAYPNLLEADMPSELAEKYSQYRSSEEYKPIPHEYCNDEPELTM